MMAIWMQRTGALRKLHGISMSWLTWPLLATAVLCKATSATLTMFMGLGVLWWTLVTRSRLALAGFIVIAPLYIALRASGLWHAEQIISIAEAFDEERAQSFAFRVENEDILVTKALRRPMFGWGGWGRSRVYDQFGRDVSITDGRWVIELGAHGWFGLVTCFAMMLLPVALLVYRVPAGRFCSREYAPVAVLAMMLVLYAIDSIPNSMNNPIYVLAGGAVVNVALAGSVFFKSSRERETSAASDRDLRGLAPLRRLHPGSV
jgi:hypothetical protein